MKRIKKIAMLNNKQRICVLFFCIALMTLLSSCQNKTKQLLAKKWDCVKIDNLSPIDRKFITSQDSVNADKMEAALKELTWTFNSNSTYLCQVGEKITVQGIYEIAKDEKTLTCTSSSQNTSNTYIITALTDNEMILTSTGITVPLVMHFRPR
jgi:NhaP-type Na+/H+ and K+/H+ antiporter